MDQEEASNQAATGEAGSHEHRQKPKKKQPQQKQQQQSVPSSANERYKNYELLLHIENEHEIKIPKDVSGSVRVLKQMLNNPLVFREPCRELDKKQAPYRSLSSKQQPVLAQQSKQSRHMQPKVQQVNGALDEMKDRSHVTEMNLVEALASADKTTAECSKRLFDQVSYTLPIRSLNGCPFNWIRYKKTDIKN